MKTMRWVGPVLAAALCAAPMAAQAGTSDDYPFRINEHHLTPADTFNPEAEPGLTEGTIYYRPDTQWVYDYLAEHARYTNPFFGPDLFPRISAGTALGVDTNRDTKNVLYSERLDLNLYWLQLRLPMVNAVDSTTAPAGRIDADLLLPFRIDESNRAGLVFGTSIPFNGLGTAFLGYRAQLMYGFGYGPFDITGRIGYGVEPITGAANGPAVAGLLYGATAGLVFTDWVRLAVELDGSHNVGAANVNQVILAPGFRFFPTRRQDVELGLAAVLNFGPGDTETGLRTAGGLFTAAYNFY